MPANQDVNGAGSFMRGCKESINQLDEPGRPVKPPCTPKIAKTLINIGQISSKIVA
jgi:hypothetical protein